MGLVNERVRPFVRPVGPANSLEKKLGWLAFPGLIRGITIIHVMMFMVAMFLPDSIEMFVFDWGRTLEGEYWRVVSFIFLPPIVPDPKSGAIFLPTIFMFFAMRIAFMMNDGLEDAWGIFRTSIYCFSTIFCIVLATVIGGATEILLPTAMGGWLFYSAVFLAFGTLFPNVQFMLFFIIPIKVWVLAMILGGLIFLGSFGSLFGGSLFMAAYHYICFFPYLVWAVPRFLRWNRTRAKTAVRRAKFKEHQVPAESAFHTCAKCGATDVSEPEREFRVTQDDRELCSACLDVGESETSGT